MSLFERGGHVLATVDDEIAARIHAELAANGIKLFTGADTRRLVSKTVTYFYGQQIVVLVIFYSSHSCVFNFYLKIFAYCIVGRFLV